MTSSENGAPQVSIDVVLDMATEKLYGASRGPRRLFKLTQARSCVTKQSVHFTEYVKMNDNTR